MEDGRVALVDILAKFSTKIDTSKSFSHASLSDFDDSTNKLFQDESKYFTCSISGRYKLHLNTPVVLSSIPSIRHSPLLVESIPPISTNPPPQISLRTLSIPRAAKPDSSIIFASPVDLEIAVMLSSLVYCSDPSLNTNETFPYSTNEGYSRAVAELSEPGCGLKCAKNASYPYLMAVSKRLILNEEGKEGVTVQRTLWIAFPGTQNKLDILADLAAFQKTDNWGCLHAGFLYRANAMPNDFFIEEFLQNQYDRMIFTGHSLGGAVAHICAMKQLSHSSSSKGVQIYSIAFGSPFIGDDTLERKLRGLQLSNRLLTVVNEQDAVPGVLLLLMTAKKRQPKPKSLPDIFSDLCESAKTYALNALLGKTFALIKPLLSQLLKCIKPFFRYTPVGTYAFLCLDSPNQIWKPVIDSMEIINRIKKTLFDIKAYTYSNVADHFLNNYISNFYHLSICTRIQPVPSIESRRIRILEEGCSPQIAGIDVTVEADGESVGVQIKGSGSSCIHKSQDKRLMSMIISDPETTEDWTISPLTKGNKWVAHMKKLLPSHARITIGAHYINLHTHFDRQKYFLDPNNIQMKDEPNHKLGSHFNANMLYASLLRACFAFLHETENPDKKFAINKHLMAIHQLIQECNSESDSRRFTDIFDLIPSRIGELLYYDNFHEQMPIIILSLYKSLVRSVSYKDATGYLYSAMCFVTGAAAVVAIGSNPVGWVTAGVFVLGGLYVANDTKKQRQYYGVEQWAYFEHLKLITKFICVSATKCTDEDMFENEIIKKLDEFDVPEKIEDTTEIPEKIFLVKYRQLDKKKEALRFARQTTLIHNLRLSVNRRIYVAFVNNGTRNQLLKTLWKIPSHESSVAQVDCYPLSVQKGKYELVILLLPNRLNLDSTLNKLKHYYTIEPKLCVIISDAKDVSVISTLQLPSVDARRISYQRLQNISKKASVSSATKQVTIFLGSRSMQEIPRRSDDICWTDSFEIENKEKIVSFLNTHLRKTTDNAISNIESYEYHGKNTHLGA